MKTTRQEAKDVGDSRYFTGKPCKHGHTSPRRTKDGNCVQCTQVKATKRYYSDTERFKSDARLRYKEDPEKFKSRRAAYHAANPEPAREYRRKYWIENKGELVKKNTAYVKARLKVDPVFAVSRRMRTMIGNCLRVGGFKKTSRTAEILGCDWQFFKAHIERQFLSGMTWANMGKWHIDHITPMASAGTQEEAIALNHVTNLRPIWGVDNLAKHAKIEFLI